MTKDNVSGNNFKILNLDNIKYRTRLTKKFTERIPFQPSDPKKILSFIPGAIRKVNIKVGSRVKLNDILIELEAMKMNNYILAPMNGVIKRINVKPGENVPKAHLLIEFK